MFDFSTLLFSLPIIIALAWISGVQPSIETLLILPFFISLLIISYAIGTVLAIIYVYLRDLRHAIGLILQIWFYATPIIYDKTMIPEKYKFVLYINPVGASFVGIQESVLGITGNIALSGLGALFWSTVSLVLLRFTFRRFRSGLPEVL